MGCCLCCCIHVDQQLVHRCCCCGLTTTSPHTPHTVRQSNTVVDEGCYTNCGHYHSLQVPKQTTTAQITNNKQQTTTAQTTNQHNKQHTQNTNANNKQPLHNKQQTILNYTFTTIQYYRTIGWGDPLPVLAVFTVVFVPISKNVLRLPDERSVIAEENIY